MKMTAQKKILIYKVLIFVFAFIVAFMPSTASRSKEVNSRVIVEILGVDGGDKVSVTAQYVMPTETQGATSKDTVTVEGDTLTEAVEAISTALGRRAELGHCSMVIVGSEAKPELLGTLMTSTDVTADVYISAAEDKASDLIGDITDFMKKTGATDADFIAYGAKKAHVATNTLLGFLCDLGSASESSFLPIVQMLKPEESGGGGSSGGDSSGGSSSGGGSGSSSSGEDGGGGEKPQQSGMSVERLALYGRDGRRGILEKESARGVAWISSPIENGIVTADVEYDGETVKNVSGRLRKKHVDIKTQPEKDCVTVKVRAVLEPLGDKFNILETASDAKMSEAVKGGFEKKIKSELEKAYSDALEQNCDPLFIGKELYRYAPEYYNTKYSQSTLSVSFDVEVVFK